MGEPLNIDPSGIYDVRFLCANLGLPYDAINHARKSGELQSFKRGRTVLYRGQWISDWIAGEPDRLRRLAEAVAS